MLESWLRPWLPYVSIHAEFRYETAALLTSYRPGHHAVKRVIASDYITLLIPSIDGSAKLDTPQNLVENNMLLHEFLAYHSGALLWVVVLNLASNTRRQVVDTVALLVDSVHSTSIGLRAWYLL